METRLQLKHSVKAPASLRVTTDNSLSFRFLYATPTGGAELCCEWTEVHHDPEFSGYSIMTVFQCQQLLALGNLHGYIKLLKLDNRGTNKQTNKQTHKQTNNALSQEIGICSCVFLF